MSDAPTTPSETPGERCTAVGTIGFLLCRVIVPAWVLAGAIFKLAEMNPNLLPPPVLTTSDWIGSSLGQDKLVWLGFSMRFIIGTEIMLAGFMFFVPRIARGVAFGILGLFVLILAILMAQGYDSEKGISSLFSGECGCFGSAGPSPAVMLLIDGLLLIGVLVFSPSRCGSGRHLAPVAAALSILVGYSVAFIVPERSIENRAAENPVTGTNTTHGGTTSPEVDEQGWTLPPRRFESYYYPQFLEWPGKKLSSIPFAQLLPRPLPKGFNEGDWLVVFYRADCEHCQEMFLRDFSGATLPTPTLAVGIPDYDPAGALEFFCDACQVTELPKGPDYVIQTPVVVRVKDGVVTCAADGSSDDAQIEQCIFGGTDE